MKRALATAEATVIANSLRTVSGHASAKATIANKARKRRKVEASNVTTELLASVGSSSQTTEGCATLESLERETMGESWYHALTPEFSKSYFQELKQFLISEQKQGVIYPPPKDIYAWSRITSLDSVKVVVIGQDPYHDVGQAHGLAFSVLPPTRIPPSLRNIYKQIKADVPSFIIPTTGDLTPLAKQGVLWLNTCLTVRAHKANSHAGKGWETFTSEVLRAVTSRKSERGVVFFAWGIPAQKTCEKIGIDETKHLVLRSPHPSPLSAHRGFLGNGHFKAANAWLRERYGDGEEIDWTVLSSASP